MRLNRPTAFVFHLLAERLGWKLYSSTLSSLLLLSLGIVAPICQLKHGKAFFFYRGSNVLD